jgi:hypothetical protein
MLIALHNSRSPFSGEVTFQRNRREHPALADLAARQLACFRLESHGFGVRAEQDRSGL